MLILYQRQNNNNFVPCSAVVSEIPLLPNFFGFLLSEVLAFSLNCCCTVVGLGGETRIARGP